MADSFPRQRARTRGFTLGAPRDLSLSPDGRRVAFLRSSAGDDPVTALWVLDLPSDAAPSSGEAGGRSEPAVDGPRPGSERLVADPHVLDVARTGTGGSESDAERARRERRREQAAGIVGYSADAGLTRAVFALDGRLWLADLADPAGAGGAAGAGPRPLDVPAGPVFAPRLDPTGRRVSWCSGRELWVADADPDRCATTARRLAGEESEEVSWGQAEFVAAEEMGRDRGHWWAPDGSGLLATRVDVSPVGTWWVADPAHPERAPRALRYPAAGTPDAKVTLWWIPLEGEPSEVRWDRDREPYLPVVAWPAGASPLLVVEQRDRRRARVLEVDVDGGAAATAAELQDGAWVAWPDGLPARTDDGRLVWCTTTDDTVRLTVDGEPVTPPGLQVRRVHHAGRGVVFSGWEEPTEVGLWRWSPSGLQQLDGGGVVVEAAAGGTAVAVARRGPDGAGLETRVVVDGRPVATLGTRAEEPLVRPRVRLAALGERRLRTGVVLPTGHRDGQKLPGLMLPYGGPAAQMVLADGRAWLAPQWWADQGFAVVVADGRGTPGRGPAWERTVHRDLAGPVLEDQVDALHAAADAHPDLDLGRVGIAGWSFGGYLSALAVLRRPEVFHAAVAGAPVTEWRLYDTYYTERFLGDPGDDPGPYDRCSLLSDAAGLSRPLLIVHGLVDDNVVVAHSLRLSQALMEHGRPHAVLPLTGVTHMASQEEVAENLLRLQARFLGDALGVTLPS